MEATDKSLARTMFKLKIHESNGQRYEDLFCSILTYHNQNFTPVKPQGNLGDRKNDGFDRTTGVYYQVYAPEDPSSKISDAIKKLIEDFNGLKSYWDKLHKINEYHFVFNDKYSGTKPALETELSKIQKSHSLGKAVPFLNKDLESILFGLDDDKIYSVIGHVPSSNNRNLVQISWLAEVANFLMTTWNNNLSQGNLVAPDFEEKIEFNKLSLKVASLLHTYNYQTGVIEKYFESNSSTTREQLQGIFSKLYRSSLKHYEDYEGMDKSDLVFFDILNKSCPENFVKEHQDSALALMSYYFESCDIFEEPKKSESKC